MVYTWCTPYEHSMSEHCSKRRSEMTFVPGGDGFIPGGDHANLSLAWCTHDVRLAHSMLNTALSMAFVPGGDWFIPGGDHANLCLAWCTHDARLAHIPCLNTALSGVQTWHLCQAETDLFQAVTMPTFLLRGINPSPPGVPVHIWMLL